MTQKQAEPFSSRLMFGGFQMPGRPNFGPVFEAETGTTTAATTEAATTTATTTEPPAATTATTTATTETAATASWRDAIKDPDLKKQAERFNSVEDIIRGNLDQRQKLSAAIIKPGKDAKPEEVAAYRKAMDIPDAPDGYEIPRPEHIDEETFNSEPVKAAIGEWTKALHEAGASKAVVRAAADVYFRLEAAAVAGQIEADKAFAKQTEDALKAEWGAEYDKNSEFAKRGFEKLATDAGMDIAALKKLEMKDGRFLLDRPEFSKLFAKLGREMGEGQIGSVLNDGERDSIQSQIDKLQDEKMAALGKGDRTRANKLDQEQNALYAKLGGNKAT